MRLAEEGFPNAGSSPLSRGIQFQALRDDLLGRIIPALAGNTAASSMSRIRCADHPRSRGEYLVAVADLHPLTGSSPLSRGIPLSRASMPVSVGIIPALAGNTLPGR